MHSYFDNLVLLIVSFVIGGLFAHTWQPHDSSSKRILLQSASSTQELSIDQNSIHIIKSTKGNSKIEIKNGSARFVNSDCAQKICIQHGWLSHLQPVIACVPNSLSIQMISANNFDKTLDAFSF